MPSRWNPGFFAVAFVSWLVTAGPARAAFDPSFVGTADLLQIRQIESPAAQEFGRAGDPAQRIDHLVRLQEFFGRFIGPTGGEN